MLSNEIFNLFFYGSGGGKSESSAEVPIDYITLDGDRMTIQGEDVTIQGED